MTCPRLTTEPSSTPRYASRPVILDETDALVRATTYPLAVTPVEAAPAPRSSTSAT